MGDLQDLPDGLTILDLPVAVIVQVIEPVGEETDETDEATAEPEVIGRPEEESDESA